MNLRNDGTASANNIQSGVFLKTHFAQPAAVVGLPSQMPHNDQFPAAGGGKRLANAAFVRTVGGHEDRRIEKTSQTEGIIRQSGSGNGNYGLSQG